MQAHSKFDTGLYVAIRDSDLDFGGGEGVGVGDGFGVRVGEGVGVGDGFGVRVGVGLDVGDGVSVGFAAGFLVGCSVGVDFGDADDSCGKLTRLTIKRSIASTSSRQSVSQRKNPELPKFFDIQ